MPPKRQRQEDEPFNVIKTQEQAHTLERKLVLELDLVEEFQSKELRDRNLSYVNKRELKQEYIRFIVLKVYLGDYDATRLSPPILVDGLWHSHILNTQSYHDMCGNICETKYIHHRPGGSRDWGRTDRLILTRGAYSVMWPGEEKDNWVWEGNGLPKLQPLVWPITPPLNAPYDQIDRKEGPGDRCLNINLVAQNDQELHFKIKRTTRLNKLKQAYADQVGADATWIRLTFSGERITEGQTAEDLNLEDGDTLEVLHEQGGC